MAVRLRKNILRVVLARRHQDIKGLFIILHESFLQFDWQRAAVFQLSVVSKIIAYVSLMIFQ